MGILRCSPSFLLGDSVWLQDSFVWHLPSWLSECWSVPLRVYHMVLFHCKISHHSTSVKVQNLCKGVEWPVVNWGSLSIMGEVMRCWLQFTSNFIGLLIPSSTDAVLCLMPPPCLASWGVVAACFSCAGLFWLYSYFTGSACLLFWAFAAFFIQCIFCNACWDDFLHYACWDSLSGFPGLW